MSLLQTAPIVIHRVSLPLLPLPSPTPSPVSWPSGVWISYGDVCNDVKISQCRLVRARFVFGKRWGGVPLRCALKTSIGGLIWSCNLHAKGIFLKFRFRGCFRAFWLTGALTGALNGALTGALTGARCQPLQCDLPMPSLKWCWTEFCHWDRSEEPNFIVFPSRYLKLFVQNC